MRAREVIYGEAAATIVREAARAWANRRDIKLSKRDESRLIRELIGTKREAFAIVSITDDSINERAQKLIRLGERTAGRVFGS